MGKMTAEKKKRREKRLIERKQSEEIFDMSKKILSVLQERDPEFKKAAEMFAATSKKYPELNDAPQEEQDAAFAAAKSIAERLALFMPDKNEKQSPIEI